MIGPVRRRAWQAISVGEQVRAIGRGARVGTVVEIEERAADGVTMYVLVRWGKVKTYAERWPTDFLVVVDDNAKNGAA